MLNWISKKLVKMHRRASLRGDLGAVRRTERFASALGFTKKVEPLALHCDSDEFELFSRGTRLQVSIDKSGRGRSTAPSCAPAIKLKLLRDTCILASSSFVFQNRKAYINPIDFELSDRINLSTPRVAHRNDLCLLAQQPRKYEKSAIFLGGHAAANWYHWIMEILPRLAFLNLSAEQFRNYPVAVPALALELPAVRASLDLFLKGRPIIPLDEDYIYYFNRIAIIDSPSYCPFDAPPGQWLAPGLCFLHREAMILYREELLQAIDISLGEYPSRLFLKRRGPHRPYNQDEVEQHLSELGFEAVYPEDYDLAGQVALFSNAQMVAGPTGAAWTNILFARPGSVGICWAPEPTRHTNVFANIAALSGMNLSYMLYPTNAISWLSCQGIRYEVDTVELNRRVAESQVLS